MSLVRAIFAASSSLGRRTARQQRARLLRTTAIVKGEDDENHGHRAGSVGDAIPVSVFKDKEDPVLLDDGEYPDWLWKLGNVEEDCPTLDALLAKDVEQLPLRQQKRLAKLERKQNIKATNASLQK